MLRKEGLKRDEVFREELVLEVEEAEGGRKAKLRGSNGALAPASSVCLQGRKVSPLLDKDSKAHLDSFLEIRILFRKTLELVCH